VDEMLELEAVLCPKPIAERFSALAISGDPSSAPFPSAYDPNRTLENRFGCALKNAGSASMERSAVSG
jgi:hypothetical protein